MAFTVAFLDSAIFRGDVLLAVMLGHHKLYGLTRLRQRFRCLKVRNRLSRTLTALALFAFTGQVGVAIDLVHLHVSFSHTLTRFIGGLVQLLPMGVLGLRPLTLPEADGDQYEHNQPPNTRDNG